MATKKKGKAPGQKKPRSRLEQMASAVGSFGADWRAPVEVLERVQAVPTIWPQLDWKLRVGGWPIQRVGVVHGPSAHGKSIFVLGLGKSFLKLDHYFALCDAEQCYDEQTEVLTRRGFVRWGDVEPDDLIGCWDTEQQSLVYEVPYSLIRRHYCGKMYRVTHGGVDLLVTPGHKMFVRSVFDTCRHDEAEWGLISAEQLMHRVAVRYRKHAPRTCAPDIELSSGASSPAFPVHDDNKALLRLIGFFIGDGWVGKERGRTNGITFTLTKKRKVNFLKEICIELGWECSEMSNNVFAVRAEGIGRLFREQFYDDEGGKRIPEYLLDLNCGDAMAVLEGLRESDGTRKRGAWEYSTTSDQVAEALQRLVLHAGGAAHIHRGEYINRVMVLSRMLEPLINRSGKKNTSWQDYDGEVFCAHTRTGVMVVRRNGKPVLSGNSTPIDFVRKLLGELTEHPGFVAQRPHSYERTVDDVREFVDGIVDAREKGKLPADVYGLIAIDSLRKLVPDKLLSKIHKQGAQKVGPDGAAGRAGQMRAGLNGQWLDELVPLISHGKIGMVFVVRESDNPDADPWALKYRIQGGQALNFDASVRARVELAGYVYEGSDDDKRVIGERHKVVIHKSKVAGRDGKTSEFYFHTSNGLTAPEGFDIPRDLIWMAQELELVTKEAGGWLEHTATGERWHGENQAVAALHANAATAALIEEECRVAAAEDLKGRDGERTEETTAEAS